ncbi:MAG: protein kinase, partial [Planctomycetota bacterium]
MPADKPPAASATIDQLVESFVGRLRAGESVSVEEYQAEYPHLASEIGEIFPSLQMLETCRPQEDAPEAHLDGAQDVPPNQLGEYRIIQEIGRGGMGIVYEAEHDAMRRRVALKVLPKSMAQRASHLARFRLEARSAGQMHHTNIVPVFEVGADSGFYFYAMQFIRGQNLDLVIEEMRQMRMH